MVVELQGLISALYISEPLFSVAHMNLLNRKALQLHPAPSSNPKPLSARPQRTVSALQNVTPPSRPDRHTSSQDYAAATVGDSNTTPTTTDPLSISPTANVPQSAPQVHSDHKDDDDFQPSRPHQRPTSHLTIRKLSFPLRRSHHNSSTWR